MKGVEGKYSLPEPIEDDIFEMDDKELKRRKIGALPGSLIEAIDLAEKSPLVREVLGDHLLDNLIANKKVEWDRYRMHVSRYETENFLPIL
jgi:glutamine synthetase